jgi:hypothetical protein
VPVPLKAKIKRAGRMPFVPQDKPALQGKLRAFFAFFVLVNLTWDGSRLNGLAADSCDRVRGISV